jgi:hypothetical protein
MNELTKEIMIFIEQNYTPLIHYHLIDGEKIYLGNKENRKCRFCGESKPVVKFKKTAHAIPEFTGNKRLFSYYECDTCNGKVSSLMESHMANYMNIWHTFSQVRGKNGVPSFKTNAKKSRVDISDEQMNIENHNGDNIIEFDKPNKQMKVTAKRASYIPIAVYKCLTKMALSIIPESELGNFRTTFKWLQEEKHNESEYNLNNLPLLFSFVPGIHPFNFHTCYLFKRKENHIANVPYLMFLLAYSNYSLQIYIPLCSEDKKLIGKQMTMRFIPTPFDLDERIDGKGIVRQHIDLSSKEPIKGEKASITIGYNNLEER